VVDHGEWHFSRPWRLVWRRSMDGRRDGRGVCKCIVASSARHFIYFLFNKELGDKRLAFQERLRVGAKSGYSGIHETSYAMRWIGWSPRSAVWLSEKNTIREDCL
jgi:hypothetical protein